MKHTIDIKKLILAYLKDEISSEDRVVLQRWLEENERHRSLLEELKDEKKLQEKLEMFASVDIRRGKEEMELRIEKYKKSNRLRKLYWWTGAAAIVLLLFWVGFLQEKASPEKPLKNVVAQHQVEMSGSVLFSDQGESFLLDGLKDTVLNFDKGRDVVIKDKGRLTYETSDTTARVVWYTLKIPRGGEYNITLADGSRIWLNSVSELRFPSRFQGNYREVYLNGEAYFEVERDEKHPFRVNSQRLNVEVLGTSFNMSVYENDDNIHVTLEKGRVRVCPRGQEKGIVLNPDEQLFVQGERLIHRKVNASIYSAWRKDRFVFENENLDEVMRKLVRWYDISYVFKNDKKREKRFTGTLLKYGETTELLRLIEMTADVKLYMKDNVIFIE